ncbi:MAG: hypothetical protein RI947_1008, partial [Candidatus Parcubacteria bacterium]
TVDIGSSTNGLRIDTTGVVSDINGNIVLNDAVDIGSSVTGVNITTTGLLSDIDGNLILNDTVDIGSSTNGLRVDTTGVINDINGNIVLNDTVDIGSSVTGVNVTTTGLLSDIDGNLILNDTVDIGSSTNGLRIDTTGVITDINSNIVLNDTVDIGSSVTGVNVTTTGLLSDIDGNLILDDTVDIGSSTNGLRVDTTGVINDINGNIVLNDTVDIGSSVTGINVTTGGVISDIDGSITFNDTLLPNTDATYDLGSTAASWRDLYLTGQLCFDDTDCLSSASGLSGGWTDDGPVVRLTTGTDFVGIGTTAPTGKLQVEGAVTGKALAIFNETGDQAILTASASGVSRLTVLNDGTLQFHQASSITTTTGNLTLNSAGGITTVSDNLVVTGTSDLQGAVSNSTGNLVLDDTTDIGSSVNGVRIDTAGLISDINGNLVLNDVVDIGSTATGLNVTVAGVVTDIDGNIVLDDATDIGSAANGIRVDTDGSIVDLNGNLVLNDVTDIGSSVTGVNITAGGLLSDIDGNLILNDTVDIGSTTNGLRIDTGGVIIDINGNIVLNDAVDIGSSVTGINVSTTGLLSDIDGNLILNDTVDIGSSTNGLRIDTTGVVSDINGNIVLNDAVDIGSSVTGVNVTTGGVLSDIDGNLILNDTVDIGSTVTGLNITTAGVISDIDGSVTFADALLPSADATHDIGSTAASWKDLYLTGQLCFDDTDCTSSFANGFIQLQGSTPGSQQVGNMNISGAVLAGYFADTSNTAYGLDPAGTSNFGGYSLKVTGGTILALDSGTVGIGTGAPVGKLHVEAAVVGKALAMFNELGDQALLTASASGVSRLTVLNDGTLQFHQASSITTTTGNLTLNSTGGTTTVSDNLAVTGTSDLQGAVSDSNSNLVLDDTVDIGSSVTGINVSTTGLLSDIDGNLILNDTVDIGSSTNGLRIDTTGVINDINGNIVLNDAVDVGSSVTGVNVTTTGLLSDIDGNLILNDTVDIGSSTNGLRIDTTGVINDINGNIVLNDTVDIGSSVTGINVTTGGVISDIDGSVTFNDTLLPNTDATYDLGSTAASWRDIYLTGQICFDDVDCFSSTSGLSGGWTDDGAIVRLSTATDLVGIGTASAVSKLHLEGKVTGKALAIFNETGDQDIFTASASGTTRFTIKNNGNVGIGTTNPAAKLEIGGSTSTITNTTGDITITSTGNLILNGAAGGNVGIGTTIASDAKLRVISTYSGATAGELYGEYIGTSFGIADTGLKQGLRVATSGTHTSGTQAQLAGLLSLVSKTGTSTVTNAYGLYSRVDNTNASGNIVNAYGLYIDDSTETGTITNDYGLYQIDTGAKNYFAGNVGIGTTNAGYPLHLSGSSGLVNLQIDNTLTGSTNTASTFLNRGDQANGYALNYFGTAGAEKWQIGLRGGNDNFYMRYLDSFDRLVIDTNGNVGVGTNSPNALFHVANATPATGGIVETAQFQRSSTGTAVDGIGQSIGFYMEDTAGNIDQAATIEVEYVDASSGTEDTDIKFYTRDGGTLAERLRIDQNGNLGVQTGADASRELEVNGDVRIDFGQAATANGVCHTGTDIDTTGTNRDLVACSGAPGDIAEWYEAADSTEQGDILTSSSEKFTYQETQSNARTGEILPDKITRTISKVEKSNGTYDANIIGIYSTSPYQTFGHDIRDQGQNAVPVALSGRVPIKITTENGPIKAGDLLTSSSTPGAAMKATQPGVVVARALEDYNNTDTHAVGKIMSFINVTWHDPQLSVTAQGNLHADYPIAAKKQDTSAQNTELQNTQYSLKDSTNSVIDKADSFAKITSANISAGLTQTQDAIVSNILSAKDIITDALTAVTINAQNIVTNALTAVDATIENITVTQKLTSPVIETDSLTASTIKPKDNTVVIDLSGDASASATPTPENSGKLASLLIKGLNNKTVASIDAAGNASFSGSLAAKSATISGELAAGSIVSDSVTAKDASVSGTVKAKEVIADNINALSDGLSSTQHSVASQSSTLQSLSGDVNNIQQLLNDLKNQPLPDPSYYQNLNQPVPASNSGQLQSNAGETILEKLTVTGYTLLSDAYVANSFAAGDVQIQGNSVLALASELKLSALDNINLFDGAVMIAKDGTITTRGEVIAQGGVRTDEIKPINAGDDIKVTLSNNTGAEQTANTVLASAQPKLKIQDGTGTEVASIDASGSAKFKDLALDGYLEATSSSVVVSAQDNFNTNGLYAPAITTNGKTIGVGTLPTNSNVIAIYNEKVTSKSLIYVTPTTPTDNKTLYIAEKVGCENAQGAPCKPHFTVAISGTVPHDIQFNWWIIN